MSSMTGFMGPSGQNMGGMASGYKQGNKIPSGYKLGQLQQFSPEQMQLFSQLFGHVGPQSFLSRLSGGDEGAFEESEAPAWRNLEKAYGQLGSRFSEFAPGAMSAQRGSGFKLAGSQLASDFSQDLASRRQDLQRQALFDLMNMSNSLLGQRPYEQFLTQKQPKSGFLEQLMGAGGGGELASMAGKGLKGAIGGAMFGGLPGAGMGLLGGLLG